MFTKRNVVIFLVTLLIAALCTACVGPDNPTANDSVVSWRLLDVTSAAGQSGKYSVNYNSESFWMDGTKIVRCLHSNVDAWDRDDEITLGGQECVSFPQPSILPEGAVLLTVNKGVGQKAQTIWDTGDYQVKLCNNAVTFFGGNIADVENCVDMERPEQLDRQAMPVTMNSGQGQEAESFWMNPDGSISQCRHNKEGVGFLGLSGSGFGAVQFCNIMPKPEFLPRGGTFVFTGATSDSHRPMETFWQDENGLLAQCVHEKVGEGFIFQTYHFGPAIKCNYWRAPQN